MMRNRKTRLAALSVVAVALIVLAGGLVASNMGFKLNKPLQSTGTNSGTNYIALPWNPQVGLVTARDLFEDIGNTPNCVPQFINQHQKANDGFFFYTFGGGTVPPNGWNLVQGEGLVVKVGADCNYIIVGSHDPGLTINFQSTGTNSGTNYYSPPYHGVAKNARELFEEIGGGIQFINQHQKANDGFFFYTFGGGTVPPNGWDLVPGEALVIKIGADQPYNAAHY